LGAALLSESAFQRPSERDIRALLALAVPVVAVQVGMMAMGVVDTMMVGRVSAADLAAVALGNLYFFAMAIFATGVLFSLDPVIAQAHGAGDQAGIARGVQRGLLLATALGALSALILLPAEWVLRAVGQPDEVVPLAAGYARAAIPGVFPFLYFVVFRQVLQAMGRLAPIVWTMVLANLANVFFNWVFIFGNLGTPAMGAVGTAVASSLCRGILFVGLVGLAWPILKPYLRPIRPDAFRAAPLRRMLGLGLPIGVQTALEYWAFALTSLLMGLLGTLPLAGHQVAITLAALTFMVPLGVGQASAVLVGRAVGAGRDDEARRSASAGLLVGSGFMCVTAGIFLTMPSALARLFTPDTAVIALAASLLPIAGVFQVFDGVQVVAAGVLRGVADTRVPMVVNLLGFWAIGLPVGAWLGLRTSLGPRGLWWGLVTGLAVVSVLLLIRVRVRVSGALERVHLEDPESNLGVGGNPVST